MKGVQKLAKLGFEPVPATAFEKLKRLDIAREKGWVYFPHAEETKILRKRYDASVTALDVDDDDAEVVHELDATYDSERGLLALDAEGDAAIVERRLGYTFAIAADGSLWWQASKEVKAPRVALDEAQTEEMLSSLNEMAPDTVDEGRAGPWTFTAIERTAKHWIVGFENGIGCDVVTFTSAHPLTDEDGVFSQPWTEDLFEALNAWEEEHAFELD